MSNKIISAEILSTAKTIIENGGVIAFPTETVYALACDANCQSAITRIYQLKKRALSSPLSVLVGSLDLAEEIAIFDSQAHLLAKQFFPGPLTLILKVKDQAPIATNLPSIGIRIPDHPIALALLTYVNIPIIGTSANISTYPSSINAKQVEQYFGSNIDLIIDGGQSTIAIHSTIVDLTNPPARIIRSGAIADEKIKLILGQ